MNYKKNRIKSFIGGLSIGFLAGFIAGVLAVAVYINSFII